MMARTRLALARGDASSDGASRKIGHIRASGDCVRQRPHPLHALDVASSEPFQTNCSSKLLLGAAGGVGPFPFAGFASDPSIKTPTAEPGRRFFVIGCGTSATIFPGLNKLL